MPDDLLPEGSHPCVSPFFSPFQRRTLPAEVANEARQAGLNIQGDVAAGFSPGAFTFPDPNVASFGFVLNDATWGKGAKLKVHFMNGSLAIKEQVETFAKLWSEPAEIDFEFGVPRAASDVRVTFTQAGFYSRLGMEARQFPKETMSLGFRGDEPEAEVRRLVLHEFGHAIGFMHEHQHPEAGIDWDEAGALAFYRPLLPPMSDADIMAQLRAVPANSFRYKFFRFDPDSIMMYYIPRQAVKPGMYRPEYGKNNNQLSEADAVVAASVYGPRDGVAAGRARKLVVDGPPVADSIDTDGEVDEYFFDTPADAEYLLVVLGDALVHVDITDADGKPPFETDRGGDTTSPRLGLTMKRFLAKGRQNVRVTGSRFAAGFASGTYTIRVTTGS